MKAKSGPLSKTTIKFQGVRGDSGLVPKSNIHFVENLPRSLESGHFLLVCDNSFVSEAAGDLTITKAFDFDLSCFYSIEHPAQKTEPKIDFKKLM